MTDTVRSEPAASAPVADDPAPAHRKRPPGAGPRPAVRSTAARWFGRPRRSVGGILSLLAGSAAIALGLCDAINHWFLAPGGLQVSTDVVGYPTLRDFDTVHYLELFLLAAVGFPVIFGVSFVLLDRIVPRLLERLDNPALVNGSGVAARLAIPGAVLGLAGAVLADAAGRRAVAAYAALGAATYAAVVLVAALVLHRLRRSPPYLHRVSEVNALLVPVTLLAVAAVSARVAIEVADTGTVDHHPFLPWPAAALGAAVATGVVAWRLRRAASDLEARRRLERDTVALVAGSVLVFLTTSRVIGALSNFDAYHEGESLVTTTSLRNGAFPWRDILFIHGPLQDGLATLVGFNLFEDSRWGASAGMYLVVAPLCFVALWVLLTRLVGDNWVLLAGYVAVVAAGAEFLGGMLLSAISLRLAFLPLVVVLLIRALRSPAAGWSVGLGAATFAAFVLTPEFAFVVAAIGLTVVAYELCGGRGVPWRRRFRRSGACLLGGVAAAGVFAAWLAANGAADDFLFYFRTFAPDHELTGGFAVDVESNGVEYVIAAVAPWVVAAVAAGFFGWRLATRREIRPAEWAVACLALAGLTYYPKFLARPDLHVLGGVVYAFPVVVYALARGLEPGDRELAAGAPGRAPRHVLSVAVVGALLVTAATPASRLLGDLPDRFTEEVASAPEVPRIGYSGNGELPVLMADTQAVVDAVGPDARLFDFTNQPALVYYLLGLDSPTRYFHVSMAIRAPNQADLIDELEADPPELVLYWSSAAGLSHWDGVVNQVRHYDVSQYVLEHYRPWVSVHGQLFYLRNDIDPPDLASLAAEVSVAPRTGDLSGEILPCDWGTAPAFLDSADQVGADGVTLDMEPVVAQATYTGWVAAVEGAMPTRVLAVAADGTVLSEAAVDVPRPDLAAAAPESIESGFSLVVPLVAGETPDGLHLVAVTPQGTAAAAGSSPPLTAGTRVRYSGNREASVGAGSTGSIDAAAVGEVPPDRRLARLDLPAGAVLEHDWLEVSPDGDPVGGLFQLTNTPGGTGADAILRPVGQGILFETVDRETDRFLVQAASCPQWRGFEGGPLYLRSNVPDDVRLTLRQSREAPG